MASRRMETKPVITCLKTLLIVYSFVFWWMQFRKVLTHIGSQDYRADYEFVAVNTSFCRYERLPTNYEFAICQITSDFLIYTRP